ncbi:MAG: hypothetical protein H0U61_09070 [Nocardioidaceae bacterium]|nr:hypothetical protein [Nocardioidaceae bacterium]
MISLRTTAAVVGTMVSPLLVAGCGNAITTDIIGAVGVSLDRAGSPQLVLAVCSGSVDEIELYGPHQGGETTSQEPIGVWRAKESVTAGTVLDLSNPGSAWTVVRDPGTLKPGESYSAFGVSLSEDQEISQVDFTLDRLKRLSADQVLYYHSKRVKADELHATVCQ